MSDDLIKRSYVYKAVDDWLEGKVPNLNIKDIPSENRPQGEWIFNPKDAIELMFTLPKCSECGFESADGGNFCSNCGARMRSKEE